MLVAMGTGDSHNATATVADDTATAAPTASAKHLELAGVAHTRVSVFATDGRSAAERTAPETRAVNNRKAMMSLLLMLFCLFYNRIDPGGTCFFDYNGEER